MALLALIACETETKTEDDPVTITVTELTRSATGLDSSRPYYISVTLAADKAGDYRLALRAASAEAPDAVAIRASTATYKYTIGTTPIKALLAYNMDGTLFDDTANIPVSITDLQDNAPISNTFNATRLSPDTAYKLNIVSEAGSEAVYSSDAAGAWEVLYRCYRGRLLSCFFCRRVLYSQ